MTADSGSGCDQDERFFPSSPELSQDDPEQLMRTGESTARTLGLESQQLPTQSEVLKNEIHTRPECTNNPTEEVPEPHDHGENLIRRRQTALWPIH